MIAARKKAVADAAKLVAQGLAALEFQVPFLAAEQAGASMYGSPRLNPFALLMPNEVALSRVLGDLVDPRGSHGQGHLFLNEVCKFAGLPPVRLREYVKVSREALTRHGRRIDVLVETQAIVLGIENKPWASQQASQLADYHEELKLRAGARKVALIFLSSQEEQSAHGLVVKLPLAGPNMEPSLATLVRATVSQVRSEKARRFVEDLISYLEWEFAGVPQIADLDGYISAVEAEFSREGERRQAIAAVMLSVDKLWGTVVDAIGDYLLGRVRAEVSSDFEIDGQYTLSERIGTKYDPWPLRRPSWPANCTISLEAQQADAKGIYVGVKAPDAQNTRVEGEHASPGRNQLEKLTELVGGGRSSPWWPWYKALDMPSWSYEAIARLVLEAPKGDFLQHPNIQQLGDLVVELATVSDAQLKTTKGARRT